MAQAWGFQILLARCCALPRLDDPACRPLISREAEEPRITMSVLDDLYLEEVLPLDEILKRLGRLLGLHQLP